MKSKNLLNLLLNIFIIFSINFDLTLAEIKLGKGDHKCDGLLKAFKNHTTQFIEKILEEPVPVTMCTNHRENYVAAMESYKNLITNNSKIHNTSCKSEYFDQDRLNIVQTLYDYVEGLWQKANCDECYFNGNLTNSTTKFVSQYDDFNLCLKNNTGKECENCDGNYTNLNSIYNSEIKKTPNDKVCFDIEDMMNRSRSNWSKDLNCCARERNLYLFAGATSGFALIPLIFYFGMYYYTKRKEINESELLTDSEIPNNRNTLPTMSEVTEEPEDSNEIEAGTSNESLKKSCYTNNFEGSSKLSVNENNDEYDDEYDDDDDEDPLIVTNEANNFLNISNEKKIPDEKFLNIRINDNDSKNSNVISAEVHGESQPDELIKLSI